MSKRPDPEMSPKQGMDAIFELVTGVTTAATTNDLKGLDTIIGQIRGVVTSTGFEISGFGDTLAGLKSQTAKVQCHGENTDAAMWLVDLDNGPCRQSGRGISHVKGPFISLRMIQRSPLSRPMRQLPPCRLPVVALCNAASAQWTGLYD